MQRKGGVLSFAKLAVMWHCKFLTGDNCAPEKERNNSQLRDIICRLINGKGWFLPELSINFHKLCVCARTESFFGDYQTVLCVRPPGQIFLGSPLMSEGCLWILRLLASAPKFVVYDRIVSKITWNLPYLM